MLLALIFWIIAIIAAIFGLGGLAIAAAGILKLLFFILLVAFIITLIVGMTHPSRTGVQRFQRQHAAEPHWFSCLKLVSGLALHIRSKRYSCQSGGRLDPSRND